MPQYEEYLDNLLALAEKTNCLKRFFITVNVVIAWLVFFILTSLIKGVFLYVLFYVVYVGVVIEILRKVKSISKRKIRKSRNLFIEELTALSTNEPALVRINNMVELSLKDLKYIGDLQAELVSLFHEKTAIANTGYFYYLILCCYNHQLWLPSNKKSINQP